MWVTAFHTIFLGEKAAMDLRGHVLDDAVDEVKALVVVGLGGDKLLKNSEQTGLRGGTTGIKLPGEAGKTQLLPKASRHLRFYLQQSWKWMQPPSPGRPAGAAPEGGCSPSAPTGQAGAGGGIKPCRRRGWSWRGSLEGATSPGTRTEETLPKKPEDAATINKLVVTPQEVREK